MGDCKGLPSPHSYYNLKKKFLRRLWRLVFLMLYGESDGLPGGGGGAGRLQGVGDCKGWGVVLPTMPKTAVLSPFAPRWATPSFGDAFMLMHPRSRDLITAGVM